MLKSLLIALLVLTCRNTFALASSPVTYWWHTADAAVIGLHHPVDQCALVLSTKDRGVIISWDRRSKSIQLASKEWHFADGQSVPVLVQVGEMQATGNAVSNNDFLTLMLREPIGAALAHADRISLGYIAPSGMASRVDFPIDVGRLPQLLKAVERCRKLLH